MVRPFSSLLAMSTLCEFTSQSNVSCRLCCTASNSILAPTILRSRLKCLMISSSMFMLAARFMRMWCSSNCRELLGSKSNIRVFSSSSTRMNTVLPLDSLHR